MGSAYAELTPVPALTATPDSLSTLRQPHDLSAKQRRGKNATQDELSSLLHFTRAVLNDVGDAGVRKIPVLHHVQHGENIHDTGDPRSLTLHYEIP